MMQDLRGGGGGGGGCLLVGLHYFAQNSVIINQCYNNNTNDISNVIFIMIITIAKFK